MDTDVEQRNCSFCGERGRRGMKFAGGFGAMICEECVERYHRMFNDDEDLAAAHEPPWVRMSDTELLAALPVIAESARQVDDFLLQWVELCRARKLSWAAVGHVLGVSRQAVWIRFAKRVDDLSEQRRRASSA